MQEVGPNFDAIRSTLSKRYQYFIWNSHDRPVFFNDLAWHRWQELDVEAMTQAAAALVGEHDFASFARPGHGRENTVRTILACEVSCRPPKLVIGIEGTGFLWNMVRIIVGTLVQVGLGRYTPDDMRAMLAAKNRQSSGPTAPPHGLYLQWIRTNPATRRNRGRGSKESGARSEKSGARSQESGVRSQELGTGNAVCENLGERVGVGNQYYLLA